MSPFIASVRWPTRQPCSCGANSWSCSQSREHRVQYLRCRSCGAQVKVRPFCYELMTSSGPVPIRPDDVRADML